MNPRFLIAFFMAVLVPALASGKGTRSEKWTIWTGQGIVEYTIRKGGDNVFRITCDENASDAGAATEYGRLMSIDIEIRGQEPPENGTVLISIDDTTFKFSTDESRTIETFNRMAQSSFHAMWRAMTKGRAMRVTFSDGRRSPFSLLGAREALGPSPCETTAFGSTR